MKSTMLQEYEQAEMIRARMDAIMTAIRWDIVTRLLNRPGLSIKARYKLLKAWHGGAGD